MADDRTALMSAKALSPGYEVLWYSIDKVLGQGGFGITYLAHDRNLDRAVAIKEYLPTSFAYRQGDCSIKPITGDHRENFVWGLGSFLKEAQTLARFSHRNIVRVHSVFEENNTAYMVMEYEHGQNLARLYKQGTRQNQAFYERIFFPIMDGLSQIHQFDFIHRDIKPANIYLREDGTPVLIDFGSARQTTQQQTGEMTTLVSQGYTPLEQYSANYGEQGPWTDIYALAATLYEGITGRKPDEALSRSACLLRSKPDLVTPLHAKQYPGFSQGFLNAVFAGLTLEPEGRPQSLDAWKRLFEQEAATSRPDLAGAGFTALEDERTIIKPRAPLAHDSDADFDSFSDLADAPIDTAPGHSMSYRRSGRTERTVNTAPRRFEQGHLANRDGLRETQPTARARAPAKVGQSPGISDEWLLDRTDHDPIDTDPLNIDDEGGAPSTYPDETGGSRYDSTISPSGRDGGMPGAHSTQRSPIDRRSRHGWLFGGLAVLLVAMAGGAWWFLAAPPVKPILDAATLSAMPPPGKVTPVLLPHEAVLAQLDDMARLAPLLAQAYRLSPDNSVLLDTIRATDASLFSLAQRWNASQYADIASRLRTVSAAMPSPMHAADRLESILIAAQQANGGARVLAMIEDEHYLNPAGASVLDRITALSVSEVRRVRESEGFQRMMENISSRALASVAESRYEDAARLTEAALTLDAGHEGFIALRAFLRGS